ncbi:MAG: hypothetical protein WD552_01115 [Candidatus Paceibacterota bacterium]
MDVAELSSPLNRPVHEATKSTIQGIRQDASFFLSEEYSRVARMSADAGDWRHSLEEVTPSLAALEMKELHLLPYSLLERVRGGLSRLKDTIRQVKPTLERSRGKESALPQQVKEEMSSLAERLVDDLSAAVSLQVAVRLRKTDAQEVSQLVGSIKRNAAKSEELAGKIEEMARASQEATRKLGVEANASHFSRQASEHVVGGRKWLLATAVAGLGTAAWALSAYDHALDLIFSGLTSAQLVQVTLAKLAVFSVLAAVAIWCGTMYRTHRHNYVVNRHRQNALATFETFASSTDDPQVKHAILTQATGSIFLPQHTGYGGSDGDRTNSPQVIEMVRSFVAPKE